MTATWNPEKILGLQRNCHQQQSWRCAGILPAGAKKPSSLGASQEAEPSSGPTRCSQPLRQADNNTIRRLLAEMAHELPDQVDYSMLLHLARACLCTDASPEPHRGRHEARVIYGWTELMGREACRIREGGRSDVGEGVTSTSQPESEDRPESNPVVTGPSSPQLNDPLAFPGRPRLKSVTASTISQRRRNSPHSMTRSTTPSSISTRLTISTARNSAHHPHAPPSPPDSATFPPTGASSPTAFPFPQLPLYQPVPLSLAALNSGAYHRRRGDDGSAATPDDETPPTPCAMTSFEAAAAAATNSLAPTTTQYATVPLASHNSIAPPLATATTIATDTSTISADSSRGGDLRCAIMSMPPRVGADHGRRRQRPPSLGVYSPSMSGSAPDVSRRLQSLFPSRPQSIQDGGRSRRASPHVVPTSGGSREDTRMREEIRECASEMSAIRAELAAMRAEMMQALQQREAHNDEELCRPASSPVPRANVSEALSRTCAAMIALLTASYVWVLVNALRPLKTGEAASWFKGVLACTISTAGPLFGAAEARYGRGHNHHETGRRGEGFQQGRALRRKASIGKMV